MSDERRQYQSPRKILKTLGVRRGMTVADLGCGPGFFTIPLASIVGRSGLVYAVDSHSTMLRHLRANIRKSGVRRGIIRIVEADVSRTRIPPRSADIVLLIRLLHDIADKKAFLKEVRRICKPDGKVVDLDWKKVRMNHGPPQGPRLGKPESRKILTDNGLQVT
jgi:ubiquinone/menaquinone biosynthesis C-methylase UbiE